MKKHRHKVLIIYFSLSGQSRGLINLVALGLKKENISVNIEKIRSEKKISFPFNGIFHTFKMMIATFFRWRIPIKEISSYCYDKYDLIILAGPTWSYNPSGPILSLLDNYGESLFSGKRVLPLISCRGYYRIHNILLRKKLKNIGTVLEDTLVFSHPVTEPWSSFGVFFKSSGYDPVKMKLLKKHFPHFGHSLEQLKNAQRHGQLIGRSLIKNEPTGSLQFNNCK